MKLFQKKHANRWVILDQTFYDLFIAFSLIELTNVGAGLIDGLIVGRFFSADDLAAAGISHPIFSIAGIFGGMFAMGTRTLCTRALGRGDVKDFNRLFSAVMYLGTIVSTALMVILLIGAEPLAIFLGASGKGEGLVAPAAIYLRGVVTGLPALIMTGVLTSGIQMDSGRKRVMAGSMLCSALNVFFDLVAVYFKMGMFGVGLATSVAQYLEVAYLFLHFRTSDRMLRFVPLSTSVREMLHLLSCGTEKAVRRVASVLRPVLVNKLIIFYGGAMAMTAMSVENSLCNFTQFFAVGLADATSMLIGVLYGEMNDEGISESKKCIYRNCVIFCGSVCALFLIFARPIAAFYIKEANEQLLDMASFAIRMVALQAPINGIVRSRITYLQAIGRTRNMQALTFVSSLVYVVGCAFALGALFGAYGIFASYFVSDLLTLITVWIFYCIKTRKLAPTMEDFMNLPEGFHRGPGDVIFLDIRDMDDVSLVSEQIQLFCRGHRIDSKVGNRAALCFEELATNTIEYGFPKCKKDPGIDLRVVYDPKELIIRMQDKCPVFDVERQIAMAIDDGSLDPEERLGLKVLGAIASDISYVHSLETNNVILRFPLQTAEVKA